MRHSTTLALALFALASCEESDGNADSDPGDSADSGTMTTTGVTTSSSGNDTDPTASSSTTDPTVGTGTDTDTDTDTGGPVAPGGFCAIMRGRIQDTDDFSAVYLLDNDLSPILLLPTSGSRLFPSPSGRQFAHVENGEVWVYDIDAGAHTQVSQAGGQAEDQPLAIEWAPTGEALLYKAPSPMGPSFESVYVVRPDGTDHTELTTRGESFRATFGHGNVAATIERPMMGGPTLKIKLVDMDAATPTSVEGNAYPGVDECASSRPIVACGDGVLAEVGDCVTDDVFQVHGDGSATRVTNDGMGGTPAGCAPITGRAVFSRNLALWGAPLDGSAAATDISGAAGYSGDGAEVLESEGRTPQDTSAQVYFESQMQRPSVASLQQLGSAVTQLVDLPVDIEVPPNLGLIIALFTFAAEQTSGYVGGLATAEVQKVYDTMPGERILESHVVRPTEATTDPDEAALLMMTTRGSGGFSFLGYLGDGTALGDEGVIRPSEDPFTIFNCVSRIGSMICLTEEAAGQQIGLLVLALEQYLAGDPMGIVEQILADLPPENHELYACDPGA